MKSWLWKANHLPTFYIWKLCASLYASSPASLYCFCICTCFVVPALDYYNLFPFLSPGLWKVRGKKFVFSLLIPFFWLSSWHVAHQWMWTTLICAVEEEFLFLHSNSSVWQGSRKMSMMAELNVVSPAPGLPWESRLQLFRDQGVGISFACLPWYFSNAGGKAEWKANIY